MKLVIEMMTRHVDYERFRNVYYSEAFNQEVIKAVNLKERTLREHQTLPDGKERMRMYIAPRVDLPSMISKLVGDTLIAYEEITVYDPATRRATVDVQSAGGDMIKVSATSQFMDEPDGIRTHIELQVDVKIFGIGSMIERFIANETRKRYEAVERTLQQFVDHGDPGSTMQSVPVTA